MDKMIITLDGLTDLIKFISEMTIIGHRPFGEKIATPLHEGIHRAYNERKKREVGWGSVDTGVRPHGAAESEVQDPARLSG
jgi:hypothetical protein